MSKTRSYYVLRHEPQEFDDKSVFEGKVYTAHSQIFSKAANAKMHGAKAVSDGERRRQPTPTMLTNWRNSAPPPAPTTPASSSCR